MIDVIEAEDEFRVAGIVDSAAKLGQHLLGYPFIGTDEDLPALYNQTKYFLICVGHIKSAAGRIGIFERLKSMGAELPVVISPTAYVSRHARIGEGTVVMHRATVNAGAETGPNCILNTGCLLEHDATVGAHSHISTNAVLNGGVHVGTGSFVGSNSVVIQGVRLGDYATVGAGAVVVRDVEGHSVYVGNPARRI